MFDVKEGTVTNVMIKIGSDLNKLREEYEATDAELAYGAIHALICIEDNERFFNFLAEALQEVIYIHTMESSAANNLPDSYRMMRKSRNK